jgi:hypothetical protein
MPLARLYLAHKADLGVPRAKGEDILQRVDAVDLTLVGAVGRGGHGGRRRASRTKRVVNA